MFDFDVVSNEEAEEWLHSDEDSWGTEPVDTEPNYAALRRREPPTPLDIPSPPPVPAALEDRGQEYVFVPFSAIFGDAEDLKQSIASIRAEYQIIQRLKKIYGMEDFDEGEFTYEDMRESGLLPIEEKDTIEDIERKFIQRRCEEMRPDATWADVAESLGMSKKTLWKKRKRYDVFNPEGEGGDTHSKDYRHK